MENNENILRKPNEDSMDDLSSQDSIDHSLSQDVQPKKKKKLKRLRLEGANSEEQEKQSLVSFKESLRKILLEPYVKTDDLKNKTHTVNNGKQCAEKLKQRSNSTEFKGIQNEDTKDDLHNRQVKKSKKKSSPCSKRIPKGKELSPYRKSIELQSKSTVSVRNEVLAEVSKLSDTNQEYLQSEGEESTTGLNDSLFHSLKHIDYIGEDENVINSDRVRTQGCEENQQRQKSKNDLNEKKENYSFPVFKNSATKFDNLQTSVIQEDFRETCVNVRVMDNNENKMENVILDMDELLSLDSSACSSLGDKRPIKMRNSKRLMSEHANSEEREGKALVSLKKSLRKIIIKPYVKMHDINNEANTVIYANVTHRLQQCGEKLKEQSKSAVTKGIQEVYSLPDKRVAGVLLHNVCRHILDTNLLVSPLNQEFKLNTLGHIYRNGNFLRNLMQKKYNLRIGKWTEEEDNMMILRYNELKEELDIVDEEIVNDLENQNGRGKGDKSIRNIIGLYLGQDLPWRLAFEISQRFLEKIAGHSTILSHRKRGQMKKLLTTTNSDQDREEGEEADVSPPRKAPRNSPMTLDEQLTLMELVLKDKEGGFKTVDQVDEKEVNRNLVKDQFKGRSIPTLALQKNWRQNIKPALGVSKDNISTVEGLHMFERKLLRTVLNSGAKHVQEVIWENLQDSFPTKDVYYLSYKFHTMTRYISRTKEQDFSKALAPALKNG